MLVFAGFLVLRLVLGPRTRIDAVQRDSERTGAVALSLSPPRAGGNDGSTHARDSNARVDMASVGNYHGPQQEHLTSELHHPTPQDTRGCQVKYSNVDGKETATKERPLMSVVSCALLDGKLLLVCYEHRPSPHCSCLLLRPKCSSTSTGIAIRTSCRNLHALRNAARSFHIFFHLVSSRRTVRRGLEYAPSATRSSAHSLHSQRSRFPDTATTSFHRAPKQKDYWEKTGAAPEAFACSPLSQDSTRKKKRNFSNSDSHLRDHDDATTVA